MISDRNCRVLQGAALVLSSGTLAQIPAPAFGAEAMPKEARAESFRLEDVGRMSTSVGVGSQRRVVVAIADPEGYEREQQRFKRRQRTNDLLEISYQVLSVIDLAQTLDCMHKNRCSEANPFLGRHPSDGTLIAFKAGVGVTHFLIHRLLRKRPRDDFIFEVATNVVQGTVVGLNMRYAFK